MGSQSSQSNYKIQSAQAQATGDDIEEKIDQLQHRKKSMQYDLLVQPSSLMLEDNIENESTPSCHEL